jgi:hypothetical protein
MGNTPPLVYNIQIIVFNLLILLNHEFINVVSNPLMNCVKYTNIIQI